MRSSRLIGFLALPACLLASCRHASPTPSAAVASSVAVDAFAWISGNSFDASVAGRRLGPVIGSFTEASDVLWTATGNFAAAVSIDKARDASLVVIDARNGTHRRITCTCTRAEPVGGDRVAYIDDRNTAQFLDFSAASSPQPLELGLPPGQHATQVMASVGDTLLVRANTHGDVLGTGIPSYEDDTAYVIRPGQPARALSSNTHILGSIAAGGHDNAGRAVFMIMESVGGGSCNTERVFLYHPDEPAPVALSYDGGPAAGNKHVLTFIGDSWWDAQGRLNSMLTYASCYDQIIDQPSPSSWWRWDGRRWAQVDNDTVTAARILRSGDQIVVAPQDGDQALILRHGSARTQIDTGVRAVAAPPL
jgi:hypothetical protein